MAENIADMQGKDLVAGVKDEIKKNDASRSEWKRQVLQNVMFLYGRHYHTLNKNALSNELVDQIQSDLEARQNKGKIRRTSNYILPFKSGSTVRAIYLKNSFGFQLSKCGSIIFTAQFVNLQCMLFLMGIVSLIITKVNLFNRSTLNTFSLVVFSIFCFNLILMFLLTKITIKKQGVHASSWHSRIINIFSLFADGLKAINQNTGLVIKMIFL